MAANLEIPREYRVKSRYSIGDSIDGRTVEGRRDLRHGMLHDFGSNDTRVLLHYFNLNDDIAVSSLKNLMTYTHDFLLRLHGRALPPKDCEGMQQIILSEDCRSLNQWMDSWLRDGNRALSMGYLLDEELQQFARDLYSGLRFVREKMRVHGISFSQYSLDNIFVSTDDYQEQIHAKISKIVISEWNALEERHKDFYQFHRTMINMVKKGLGQNESIPDGLQYCFDYLRQKLKSNIPLLDINFENHPELWTPKKRNVYRSRALGKWKELTQADCYNLEQKMKNILTKLRKYVDWVDDIVNGTHDPGNQFLMHLRYDPKLRRSTRYNQYSSTFEGFLLFSRNLIEHKPAGWTDADVDQHLSEHYPMFLAVLHEVFCEKSLYVSIA